MPSPDLASAVPCNVKTDVDNCCVSICPCSVGHRTQDLHCRNAYPAAASVHKLSPQHSHHLLHGTGLTLSELHAAMRPDVDALEDSSEDLLWQWELRDVKAIPKALKPAARAHKKLMQKVWYPHLSCKSLLHTCMRCDTHRHTAFAFTLTELQTVILCMTSVPARLTCQAASELRRDRSAGE